jgi:hypothetical protein
MTTNVLLPALLRTVACALFLLAALAAPALAQNPISLPDGTVGQNYGDYILDAGHQSRTRQFSNYSGRWASINHLLCVKYIITLRLITK